MANIHLIGTVHGTDVDTTINKLMDLKIGPGTIYFSELQRKRILDPASRPVIEDYVKHIKAYVLGKKATIVPMGINGFPSYKPNPRLYMIQAMTPVEDRYMVEKVVLPNLGNCELAVIETSMGCKKDFLKLLEEQGLEARCHDLVNMSPMVLAIESVMDYAEGRRDTILKSEFFDAFYTEMAKRLGIPGASPVALDKLFYIDPRVQEAFNAELKDFDFEAFDAEQYARVPHPIKAQRIMESYVLAKKIVSTLFDPEAHAPITLESEKARRNGNQK